MNFKVIMSFAVLLLAVRVEASTAVNVASSGDGNAEYALQMLRLAIEKTGSKYQLDIRTEERLSAIKMREDVEHGALDVIWTATSSAMEKRAIPVRIPLYKGLLGYRVLLVNRNNSEIFSSVRTLNDLKKYTFGQGRGWSDVAILQNSGLNVVQANSYEGLFHMTDGGRFSAFPRGIHEPWGEMVKRPDLELTVDRHLLLVYTMPFYLYVSPGRPELAMDIERGLRIAIDDGSFDEVFYSSPTVQMALSKANLKQRTVIHLSNPDLSSETPLADETLWFDLEGYSQGQPKI